MPPASEFIHQVFYEVAILLTQAGGGVACPLGQGKGEGELEAVLRGAQLAVFGAREQGREERATAPLPDGYGDRSARRHLIDVSTVVAR